MTTEDEQHRLILEAAENAMLLVNPVGSIAFANSAAERCFGYPPGALRGQLVEILECAEIQASLASLSVPSAYVDPLGFSMFGGGTARRADGVTFPVQIVSRKMNANGREQLLISVRPPIERRRMDDRSDLGARAAEPNGAGAGTERVGRWRYDVGGELWWSDEIFAIYGLPPTQAPTIEAAIAGYDPQDRPRVAQLAERAMREGTAYRDEARIIRPDGSARFVVHSGSAERSPDGAIIAITGFFADVTTSKTAERERERLGEYVTLANQAGKVGIWELDLATNVSAWDRNMYAIYGIADTTTVPTFEMWTAALHPHDRDHAAREIKTDLAGGAPSDSEFRVIWQNGEIHTIRSLATLVRDPSGAASRIIGTDWDVTEIRSLGEALREEKEALTSSEARYRALTEAMPQMVWVVDAAAKLEYVNQRMVAYTGLSLDDSRDAGIGGIIDAADVADVLARSKAAPPQEFECEARVRRSDGVYRWHLVRSVPFHDATGDAGKWITTATDIEERKAAEKKLAATVAELEHLALHDSMTNLPNRMLLIDRLTQAIAQANRARGGVIVLYVDLDRFKAVNDSLGHAAGDVVLRETGSRIVGTLRAGDTASRIGGDEFIVVCASACPADDVVRIGSRLIDALTVPIDVGGELIVVESSIGISVYPADGADADTLIRKADAAMYSAKQSGRNTFRQYSNDAHIAIVAAAAFEGELRHAIAAGELVVYYQPIIGLQAGRPTGGEALVRWQHPLRGLLAPGEFIAFAEERGLVGQIGDVVLDVSCAMLQRLGNSGRGDLTIAVNVSAHQFGKASFVAGIVAALDRYAIDPHRLTVEITESVVMGNTRETIAKLDELRELGVRLSMDDFGTGYSSLAYIKKFPINTLKIDRSFVRDIAEDLTDQAIAKTIITLAHSLGMHVVAEGVETQDQLVMLDAFGADSIQGYLFSRPLSSADFEQFLDTPRLPQRPAGPRVGRGRRRPRLRLDVEPEDGLAAGP